jgi:hyperosmotically inducible periplasmic protein
MPTLGGFLKLISTRFFLIAALAVSMHACSGRVDAPRNNTVSANSDAENTSRNQRDKNEAATTPLDQSENRRDLDITANIRKAIVDDGSLSVNAHNVKIITNGGVVTLRGPVESAQEKKAVEMKATHVPGVARVENQLEIEK